MGMFSYTNHHQKKIQIQHRPRSQNTKTTTPTTEAQKKKIWVQPSPPPPSTRPPTPLACQPSPLLWALKKEEKKTKYRLQQLSNKSKQPKGRTNQFRLESPSQFLLLYLSTRFLWFSLSGQQTSTRTAFS